ncbi:MAG: valine--tRNA ligase [Nitrospirota bacterium]
MTQELSKTYEPKDVENKWYSFWLEKGFFHADENSDKKPYTIVIPPPNITGSLHMGHALNNTLQDILIRWKRMSGYNALWMPGTDHAGIATQNVVEKQLSNEGTNRHAIGRDKFIERVWKWREESGGTIIRQLKRLGSSCDWDRERFTMDEGLSEAVKEVFVRLYNEGLIYRDNYIINWCPRCHTALSDLEVDSVDTTGALYHIRYPIIGSKDAVVVATTRPETMLGDTAVAINPDDKRYKNVKGKKLFLPIANKEIPVIEDAVVDMEFGTGAVKVTPAHDPADFEMGKRHNLSQIVVIDDSGNMTAEAGGKYKGMKREECRKEIVKQLEEEGYLIKKEAHQHAVGHCYRCRAIVEPLVKLQWFVKIKPLAEEAIKAVEDEKIRFIPKGWENTYFEWMRNIKDWCISRQIWWGHQIPAWYCCDCFGDKITIFSHDKPSGTSYTALRKSGKTHEEILGSVDRCIIDKSVEPIVSKGKPKCPKCNGSNMIQEPDVLDTWFSSALWPFSTLGWPQKTKELSAFYPTDTLVTGFDIIFFWVARMIMMGLKFMNDAPFKDVYIHALVRDAEGQKMSKSKGNVIDPLIMIDKYGADALRFTLSAMASPGRDIKLSEERIEGYRNFCNKLWNASRFAMMNIDKDFKAKTIDSQNLFDKWILSRLNRLTKDTTEALKGYRFDEAANGVYQFIWHEFCDWYLELIKPVLNKKEDADKVAMTQTVLIHVLESSLRLLHPFMPFITEEIWQRLPRFGEAASISSIMTAPFPVVGDKLIDNRIEDEARLLQDAISSVRNIRGEMNIKPSVEIDVLFKTADENRADFFKEYTDYIKFLTRAKGVKIGTDIEKPKMSATGILKDMEVYIPIEGLVDFAEELSRLQKEAEKIKKEIEFVNKKLGNQDFVDKAPEAVVIKEKEMYKEFAEKLSKIESGIRKIEALKT